MGTQKSSKSIQNGARGPPEDHRKNHEIKNLKKVTGNRPKMKKLGSKIASDFFEKRPGTLPAAMGERPWILKRALLVLANLKFGFEQI